MSSDSLRSFAEALLDPERPVPDTVMTFRGDIDAVRFAVYRNNVHAGLTRALAQRFPVTERLVGKDFFAGMARAYLQGHMPSSPLMFRHGDDFPDFARSFEPARGLAYLPDVAQIEAAWSRAYHAADAAPLAAAELASIRPEMLPASRLVPHPSACLIRSQHPIGSIWAAHQKPTVVRPADWRPEAVLVVRPDMAVVVHVLPPSDVLFAAALLGGAALGEAAEEASGADEQFDFGSALLGLVGLGAFSGIQQDRGMPS
ncbi:DUF2063 domain-containing protein [Mesorhizobium sp. L-8-10]|uniref:HvfC/BufC N-terminal domain-containing protein n=1 Tax=Mesorhizobium sp. L-8-10 TaxID=2744523 RepID=UPI001926829A|nr:DNA-binding domain-containing protein [Mesorhizobium sp. L-8-10]BCH35909.1 DUF2063 domain-containing protein [Mesorhizobium sp. L-8-10]